jgi:pyruvate dehydrogenase E2 component (dihydrolipoamide acetyltransferase)
MATEITMPKLSDTMTEGRLISWKKSVGEKVERGDIIAEVETDKANMELEAFTSGTLLETVVKPGEMTPVGKVIAIIGEVGETPKVPVEKELPPLPEPEKSRPRPEVEPPHKGKKAAPPGPDISDEQLSVSDRSEEEKASPMVRRLARERGIDLRLVPGSGPDGRILRDDIDLFQNEKQDRNRGRDKAPESEPGPENDISGESPSGESRPLSRIRSAIVRTVTRSWREIPHFAVTVSIDMGEAEEIRRELKESGTAVSVNDLIVKASSMALQKYPLANNSFAGDRILVNSDINIGMVVSLEDGLLVPVIKECQGLPLNRIATRSRELIEMALSGKISEADISGGTFTISNMGMFGVMEFNAVILPPQGAILAVGAVHDEAVVKNGSVCAGRIMHITLSADHRLMDGAYAARFLQELKRVLENPVTMLV